jgi:hypothetical protein
VQCDGQSWLGVASDFKYRREPPPPPPPPPHNFEARQQILLCVTMPLDLNELALSPDTLANLAMRMEESSKEDGSRIAAARRQRARRVSLSEEDAYCKETGKP